MLWGLTAADLATILLTIGSLVLLEGLLSGDNALVLAIMVRPLPPGEQKRALRYGIWGAFVFRFIAVILGSYLIRFWWLKVVGGLYLLVWIAGRHFLVGDHESQGRGRSTFGTGFWATVISVEITDIIFSIDSILAAVATSRGLPTHLQQYPGLVIGVIWVGGVLGILMMRVAAGFFIRLMEKFVGLAHGAYALVAWIGLKLFGGGMHDAFREIPAGNWRLRIPIEVRNFPWEMNAVLFWGGMVLIFVLSMAAPRPRRREVKDDGSEPPVEGLDARANGPVRSTQPGPSRTR